jgi:hypothetical protein
MRQLLALLFLLAALPVSVAQAEGGVAVQPYWTFPTDAPVTHLQTGDIDGDGLPEVVITTANGWLYVLENDGRLAWRYELGTIANDLVVTEIDGGFSRACYVLESINIRRWIPASAGMTFPLYMHVHGIAFNMHNCYYVPYL